MAKPHKKQETEQLVDKLQELREIVNKNVAIYVNTHPTLRVYEEELASDIFTKLSGSLPDDYCKAYVKNAVSYMLANHSRDIVGKQRNSRIQYLTGLQPVSRKKADKDAGSESDDEIEKMGYVDAVMHTLGMLEQDNPRTIMERKEARKLIQHALKHADIIVIKVLGAYLAGLSIRETARLYNLSKTRVGTIIQNFIAELSVKFN